MKKNRIFNSGYGYNALAGRLLPSELQYRARVATPMAIYMIFYFVTFALIEHWNRLHYIVIHTAVDDMIPFCEFFIIPYLLWFVYVCGFTLYMLVNDEDSYHEVCTFLVIGMTTFLAVSMVFPNILFLRPETVSGNNICSYLCERLYAIDTPTNVTPSIHVYNSLCVMIAVWRTNAGKMRPVAVKIFMTALGFSIILATMFLKQHSFSDVIIATGLAFFSYILIYKMGFVFVGKKRRRVIRESVFGN